MTDSFMPKSSPPKSIASHALVIGASITGLFGALLGGLHGWSDLVRNPILSQALGQADSAPAATLLANLPSSVDPRGAGTFFLILSRLLIHAEGIPRTLATLSLVAAVLLELIFLGTVFYADGNGIAFARCPLQSSIVGPIVYTWLGTVLRRAHT